MMIRLTKVFVPVLLAALVLTGCSRSPKRREAKFLDQGRKHLQSRDLERAALDFKNAIQAMPEDAEPHYQLGLTYLQSGNGQPAVNEFHKAVQLDPKHVGAQLKLAELMAISRDSDFVQLSAEKSQEILAISPDNPDALNALAFAELRLNDSAGAEAHLDQALRNVPQHLDSAITLALLKLKNNDPAGAEQVLLRSAAEAPKSPDHAVVLGRFYLAVHQPDKAEAQFRRALEIDARSGPALVSLANLLYRNHKTDEAGQMFERASALPDRDYRPLHGMFLLQSGKVDAAIAELEHLFNADRNDRGVRTRLVAAYLRLRRPTDAERVLDEALKRNPKDADALMERGEYYLLTGRYDEARRDVTGALPYRGESAQAHLLLGRIHHARGALKEEISELSDSVRLDPKLLVARVQLARALTASNSAKTAVSVLDETPGKSKGSLAVLIERNAALYALGDFTQMRQGVDRGLAAARIPEFLVQDGLLRLKTGDTSRGRVSLEEALKLHPDDWGAVQALALSYVSEKKTAQATAIVRQYTALPNSAAAQRFLAAWLAATGDHAGAIAAFQAGKSLEAASMVPDFAMADLDIADGKLDSARSILMGVLAKDPRSIKANLDMGYIEEKSGRVAEAIGFYEKTITEAPENVTALNNLAYLLADSGKDADRALMLAQKAKELAPKDPNVDDTIGWAYYHKGLYRSAVEYLAKSDASDTRRKFHLAMAYAQAGDTQRAETTMIAALKEDSNLPEAQQALSVIRRAQ